jgi:hypothetical protein
MTEYKRIIDRNAEFGVTHIVYEPFNSLRASRKTATDGWGWEVRYLQVFSGSPTARAGTLATGINMPVASTCIFSSTGWYYSFRTQILAGSCSIRDLVTH